MTNQMMFDDLEGKTIKKVFGEYESSMLLVFNDRTFCALNAYRCDDEVVLENDDFRLADWGKHARELFDLGVVTELQLQQYEDDQAKQAAKWKEDRRKQFDAMKAEFEST